MAETTETARAFFALPLPDTARAPLIAAQTRMRRADTGRLPVRFSREEQLHVTLKFLGDVRRASLDELAAIADRRAAEHAVLELHLHSVIAFGKPQRARALVVEIEAHPELLRLAAALEDDALSLGIARDERSYRPHVTLARLKRPSDARPLLEAVKLEPLRVRFTELRLYESELTDRGGVYTVVRSAPFGR